MANFWISKTIAEIEAIGATGRTDYCRLFCIDWLEWVFFHPTYSVDSVGSSSTRYVNGYDDFMLIPNDIAATPGATGAWLRDTDNLLIKTTSTEWVYKPPNFRPYKNGQSVTLINYQEVVENSGSVGDYFNLSNPCITSWISTEIPSTNVYDVDKVWMFINATTVISEDNPMTINAWGGGGVLWFDKSTRKLYINESTVSETETNGMIWNEITFNYASIY